METTTTTTDPFLRYLHRARRRGLRFGYRTLDAYAIALVEGQGGKAGEAPSVLRWLERVLPSQGRANATRANRAGPRRRA